MNGTGALTAADASRTAALPEGRLRRAIGWMLLYLQFQGLLGLVWDEQWHALVGRDAFLTPPHLLLYSSVALTGLLCLAFVFWDTVRYRQGAGPGDSNTVCVFRLFHAPMGAIGAAIAALGTLYLWSAILVDARRLGPSAGPPALPRAGLPRGADEWGTLLAIVGLLELLLNLAQPARVRHPVAGAGAFQLSLFPVLLALAAPPAFVLASRIVAWGSGAAAVAAMLLARHVAVGLYVPWAIRAGAAAAGLVFRRSISTMGIPIAIVLFDSGLIAMACASDMFFSSAAARRMAGRRPVVALGIVLGIAAWVLGTVGGHASWAPALRALPAAMAAGASSALAAGGLAEVLRRNRR